MRRAVAVRLRRWADRLDPPRQRPARVELDLVDFEFGARTLNRVLLEAGADPVGVGRLIAMAPQVSQVLGEAADRDLADALSGVDMLGELMRSAAVLGKYGP